MPWTRNEEAFYRYALNSTIKGTQYIQDFFLSENDINPDILEWVKYKHVSGDYIFTTCKMLCNQVGLDDKSINYIVWTTARYLNEHEIFKIFKYKGHYYKYAGNLCTDFRQAHNRIVLNGNIALITLMHHKRIIPWDFDFTSYNIIDENMPYNLPKLAEPYGTNCMKLLLALRSNPMIQKSQLLELVVPDLKQRIAEHRITGRGYWSSYFNCLKRYKLIDYKRQNRKTYIIPGPAFNEYLAHWDL